MKAYIIKRFLLLVPLLFGITVAGFFLAKALPGDPVYSMVGERSSPEIIEKIRKEIGEDRTVIGQYLGYVSLILKGEMGRSYYTNRGVFEDISDKFPNTLKLALAAMAIAFPLGVLIGLVSGLRRDTCIDRVFSALSLSGLSIPVFWSGLMLMLLFSLYLRLLPPSGTGDIRYLVLPALTLSLPALGTLARVTRITVIEIADAPFVRTAQAKGIRTLQISLIHIMRNALIPVVTVAGLEFGSYLNGAVLTETIFGWDGIGRFAMEGIMKRDYPVIMGCIITGTVVYVMVNLAADLLYHGLDPRVNIHEDNR